MAAKKDDKPSITLVLVVEYEDVDATDVLDGVRELIEQARNYGRPIKASLSGLPTVLEIDV